MVGDEWDVHQPKTGVIGLALWCSLAGFCLGYWVLDTVPIRVVAVCAALIGLILGHHVGRHHGPPHEAHP
jgi:hypothetical protein